MSLDKGIVDCITAAIEKAVKEHGIEWLNKKTKDGKTNLIVLLTSCKFDITKEDINNIENQFKQDEDAMVTQSTESIVGKLVIHLFS
ncbi:MAG: hypothetical protein ACFFD4_32340 [Candidatus Odinarchaeota archaeon]